MGNLLVDLGVFYFYWCHKFAIKALLVKTHYYCIFDSINTPRKNFCVSSATTVRLCYKYIASLVYFLKSSKMHYDIPFAFTYLLFSNC